MQKSRKIVLSVIGLIVLVFGIWLAYYLMHYVFFNDYKDALATYTYEEGTDYKALAGGGDVEGFDLVAENEFLKLYAVPSNGYVAVYDKRNGQVVYSNPLDPDSDSLASTTNKNYMKSQLIVSYINEAKTEGTMDSYSYSVAREDQFSVESIANGVRFIYQIGDLETITGIVPQYISKEALEDITSKMSEADAKFTLKKFQESKVADDYYEMLEATLNGKSQLRKLNTYFEDAGWTVDDYTREMTNSGVEFDPPISITIPLEYRLNADAVDVSIPMDHVVESGDGYLYKIQFLRFFAAASNEENGYILVPNGSGSIINFNNGKSTSENYMEYTYGIDLLAAEYTVKENIDNSRMALFGMFRDNGSAVFTTIEDGAANALITAGVSGKTTDYNSAFATFILRGTEKLAMFGTTGNEADLPVVEKDFYDSTITLKYTMLTGDDATYSGAANYYRNRLIAEGVLTPNGESGDIKFYYDVLGGVGMTKHFLGSQYDGMYVMTDFEEAGDIAKDLAANGITNQVMNYQGWMNGGYYHDAIRKLRIPGKLGGKSGLEKLDQVLAQLGGELFVDAAFQKVTEADDYYPATNETSRYYASGYIAEFGLVNPATLRQTAGLGYDDNRYYLVSPKFLPRYIDKFVKKMDGIDVSGISLRDLGDQLHSDKKRTNVINREQALDVVLAQYDKLSGLGKDILVSGGNDYTFAYVSDIINAPVNDNNYYIVDETIPFYEMLIHGCIDYSADLINLSDVSDRNDLVLSLIENGASPHFLFTKRNASDIKKTALNWKYASTYDNWKEEAIGIYNEVNGVLKNVTGAQMTGHEVTADGLRIVTYSNGVKVYVNPTAQSLSGDGITVAAKSYAIGGNR